MKIILSFILCCALIACASTKTVKAPCTYDDRRGCGELIYSLESDPAV